MSIKRNIVVNYIGQAYVTALGLVMLPVLIGYMGPEGFGLVAFFLTLQAGFQFLDLGLTPTMTRETARYTGGVIDALRLRGLLRAMEGAFIGLALLGCAALIAAAGFIARDWLKVDELPLDQVQHAIMLMAVVVACRWVGGLYRGVISGMERLIWLNTFNIVTATARFVLVVPVLLYLGGGPMQFFGYQLLLALLELVILAGKAYRLMPASSKGASTSWRPLWGELRRVLDFSFGIALASVVWLLVSQMDKLLLANLLSLADYGYFSAATVIAGGVLLVTGPVSGAILPRMIAMEARGDEVGLIGLYRDSTQAVAVIVVPLTLVLAFFPEPVLWAWTGNDQLVAKGSSVLSLYAIGSGLLAFGAFPYYLQNAKGRMRLHLLGSLLFVVVFVPLLILGIKRYGMVGAGWVWLLTNLASFLLWVPVVHQRFAPGLHLKWLGRDILLISALPGLVASLLSGLMAWPFGRVGTLLQLCLVGAVLVACALLGSGKLRSLMINRLGKI